MSSALVSQLTAPLRDVQAMLGTGTPDTATTLHDIRRALADVAAATGRSGRDVPWTGEAAAAATDFTEATVAAIDELVARTAQLGATTADAVGAVAGARLRLQAIIDAFEAKAAALEARIDEPGVADELMVEARRALDEANDVVDGLRDELDGHRAAVTGPMAPVAPTVPMGLSAGVGASHGSPASTPIVHAAHVSAVWPEADDRPLPNVDPEVFGSGVTVHLPDGSTAVAPNAVAASAVRHALTQLGVPYDWGGTTPGVGLDCSGLTQWAYHEAGLDLPRLAQEQDVGAAVDASSLRPGDLAVWDGHVAMIVGNGMMIEAGDPVHLSAIRTTNADQHFQGFWRPTA
ncbi:glycoside hydrolase [Mycolicibacterium madagascariense]|uniref:Glycoside hydrolase n=1 Tax=Mycolicibacterium madagascariense TaxID=212765 RepID=A0A7I7XCK4_9MYCO|nr:C40 family peptidase [Mycolicibacterium madagascariense]MCV7015651.1 C40 family peptidase [Mycolicibacterium madagascariense]BBZ27065.1 glycoside hydrolase [Mycolicibacterium madagascariense]